MNYTIQRILQRSVVSSRQRPHTWSSCLSFSSSFWFSSFDKPPRSQAPLPYDNNNDNKQQYLHMGPSGDVWTGPSLFAAKHLPPDYVRSLPLPLDFDDTINSDDNISDSNNSNSKQQRLLERLQENVELVYELYDRVGSSAANDDADNHSTLVVDWERYLHDDDGEVKNDDK